MFAVYVWREGLCSNELFERSTITRFLLKKAKEKK